LTSILAACLLGFAFDMMSLRIFIAQMSHFIPVTWKTTARPIKITKAVVTIYQLHMSSGYVGEVYAYGKTFMKVFYFDHLPRMAKGLGQQAIYYLLGWESF